MSVFKVDIFALPTMFWNASHICFPISIVSEYINLLFGKKLILDGCFVFILLCDIYLLQSFSRFAASLLLFCRTTQYAQELLSVSAIFYCPFF